MDVMQEEAGFGSTGFDGPQITGLFNFQSFFFLTVGILILYDLFQERCTNVCGLVLSGQVPVNSKG